MKIEGTEDSALINSVTTASESKLAFNQTIIACTLTDGQMYYLKPGSFHVHKARAGNNPQQGPPFVRFTAMLPAQDGGEPVELVTEAFLASLVAVFVAPVDPETEDDNENAQALQDG